MHDHFRRFADRSSALLGSAWAFLAAALVVIAWAIAGPEFHYSSNWQMVINTGTTIVTFLMVFIIQNTQNRDARATQLKLDELLRAVADARTDMVQLEKRSDEELASLDSEFEKLSARSVSNDSVAVDGDSSASHVASPSANGTAAQGTSASASGAVARLTGATAVSHRTSGPSTRVAD